MNMEDNLHMDGQDKLIKGIDRAVDAVKHTLGAKGTNALLQITDHPYTLPTSDGITIIEAIKLADPIEQMGVDLVKENSSRHNRMSGDGSTTAAVLLQAILHEARKVKDVAPVEIMDSLNECLPIILKSIDDQTKLITPSEVGKVAAIAARDEKIGALIQEIYEQIGKDGILYPDVSKTFEDSYTIGKGVKISGAGFASPYMSDLDEHGRFLPTATFKNPTVLITKQKISSADDLNGLVASLYAKEIKELVIFCDEIETNIITQLVMTRAHPKNPYRFLIVKMPVLWKDQWFEDLAKMTGATIIDPTAGVSFKTMKFEHLGKCGSIVADKQDTYLDGILDLDQHVKDLQAQDTDDAKIRIARLNTKSARLFVGAHSDAMLSYKRLRVEDARNSAYLALQYGIVAGGGLALANVTKILSDTTGGKILGQSLLAPLNQIILNAGKNWEDYKGKKLGITDGFNAKTGEVVDMFEAGIVDSTQVVKSAITNALSVASIVLTAPVIVTIPTQQLTTNNNNVIVN